MVCRVSGCQEGSQGCERFLRAPWNESVQHLHAASVAFETLAETLVTPVPLTRHEMRRHRYQGCSQKGLAPLATFVGPLRGGGRESVHRRCAMTFFTQAATIYPCANSPSFSSSPPHALRPRRPRRSRNRLLPRRRGRSARAPRSLLLLGVCP